MEPKLDLSGISINLQEAEDTITLSNYPYGYDYSNTVVNSGAISGMGSSISAPTFTVSSGTTTANPWATTASPWLGNGISSSPDGAGKLTLTGEGADIEINGESLVGLMKEIRERLNLITINEKMEKEWDELRALGEQYRALEAKLKEQGAMWEKLKAMPPPVID